MLAIQVLPKVKDGNTAAVIDKVIRAIQASGIKYKVCPFETVLEGPYTDLMQLVGQTRQICMDAKVEEAVINIKMEIRPDRDVSMERKVNRYAE